MSEQEKKAAAALPTTGNKMVDGPSESRAKMMGPMGQDLNDVARRGYAKLQYDPDLFDDERGQRRMENARETMAPREVKLEPQLGSKAGKK